MITEIVYTTVGDDVIATHLGNAHTLTWHRATGDVHRDNETRVAGYHLSERAWHVLAADYFGVPRDTEHDDAPVVHEPRLRARTCHGRGAGWGITCSCSHFGTGWCETELEAAERFTAQHLVKVAVAALPQQRGGS